MNDWGLLKLLLGRDSHSTFLHGELSPRFQQLEVSGLIYIQRGSINDKAMWNASCTPEIYTYTVCECTGLRQTSYEKQALKHHGIGTNKSSITVQEFFNT